MSLNLAVIGCGNISTSYIKDILRYPELNLMGIYDLDTGKAAELAEEHGVRRFEMWSEALDNPELALVVNLTAPTAHYSVVMEALEAGKHVYTEKPLSMDQGETRRMVETADSRDLMLFSAPITILGDAQNLVTESVRAGKIGEPLFAVAEVHNGFIEDWHPAPREFYRIGPLFDVGLYPLMHLIRTLGRVCEIRAIGGKVKKTRTSLDGNSFNIESPDFITAMLTFESGAWARMSTSFVVNESRSRIGGIEYHGSEGSITMDSNYLYNANVRFKGVDDGDWTDMVLQDAYDGIDWARGLVHVEKLFAGKEENLLPVENAVHGLDVLHAIRESADTGEIVRL